MIPADELAALRDTTESLHTDHITITRASVSQTLDVVNVTSTPGVATVIYNGLAYVSPVGRLYAQVVEFGGLPVTDRNYLVRVPGTVDGVSVDDRVAIVSSVTDDSLVGRQLRITDVFRGSTTVDRTLLCQDMMTEGA